jgi:hypothetical protein
MRWRGLAGPASPGADRSATAGAGRRSVRFPSGRPVGAPRRASRRCPLPVRSLGRCAATSAVPRDFSSGHPVGPTPNHCDPSALRPAARSVRLVPLRPVRFPSGCPVGAPRAAVSRPLPVRSPGRCASSHSAAPGARRSLARSSRDTDPSDTGGRSLGRPHLGPGHQVGNPPGAAVSRCSRRPGVSPGAVPVPVT